MSSSSSKPKRVGEDYAIPQHQDLGPDGPSTSKKPRFDLRNPSALAPDELEDDAVLDADEIGRRGQRVRRNAVNVEGYDSDSENEGFDARAEAKANAASKESKADDGSDEDMFAELEEDFAETTAQDTAADKKKQVRFLEDNEIEGQVGDSHSGGRVKTDGSIPKGKGKGKARDDGEDGSDSDSDVEGRAAVGEDIDEEVGAGGKKSHAPLLDAFNMRAEQEDGRFDESGNYVRKAADPDAIHDSWLEGVSKKQMRQAREASDKREEQRRQQSLAQDQVLASDVLGKLISNLERGETILEALARLGKGNKQRAKRQNKNKNRQRKSNGAADGGDVEMAEEDPAEVKRKKVIEEITEAADILLGRGQSEVYDAERELLMRQYLRETGEQWVDPPKPEQTEGNNDEGAESNDMWEFRWSDARDGGEIHGPYDKAMMESWNGAGYFGEGVEFRKGGENGEWVRTPDFLI